VTSPNDQADLPRAPWTPLALTWIRVEPVWGRLDPPVIISMAGVQLYGFAAISSPLPSPGDWTLRLRLGPTFGLMRLVTCDPNGQRRQPRTEVFPNGEESEVLADIPVPADYTDMCLVIQKRDETDGSVMIHGVDIAPRALYGRDD
jgi:hypothetical protein